MIDFIKKHKVLFIFAIFFLLMILTQHFVFIYADDYGYATLSYLPDFNGYKGLNPNLLSILSFLKFHYFNWGGRIIYFFIEILTLNNGMTFYHIIQSSAITIVFFLIYKIALSSKESNYRLALLTVLSFGLIEIMTLRSGFYWASASCLYIYPLIPLLLFIYLFNEKNNKLGKNIIFGILVFLASFSQEQVSILMVSYIGLLFLHNLIKSKKINILILIMLIISLVGFSLLMFCPGSFARTGINASFYELSLIQKLKLNIPNFYSIFFGKYTKLIVIVFFLTSIYYAYKNIVNKRKGILINKITLCSSCLILIIHAINPDGYFAYFYYIIDNNIWRYLVVILLSLQLISIIISTIQYYYYKNNKLIYLFLGSVLAQIAMIFTPYYALRSMLIFDIPYLILIIDVFKELINTKFINYIIIIIFILFSFNYYSITYGYFSNYAVNTYNDRMLREASNDIKSGKSIESITLHKLVNDTYGTDEPYHENFQFIYSLMKYYYNLPQNIIINYVE